MASSCSRHPLRNNDEALPTSNHWLDRAAESRYRPHTPTVPSRRTPERLQEAHTVQNKAPYKVNWCSSPDRHRRLLSPQVIQRPDAQGRRCFRPRPTYSDNFPPPILHPSSRMEPSMNPTSFGRWMALLAALLGWMFDGAEMGMFSMVGRDALKDMLADKHPSEEEIGHIFGIIIAVFLVGAAAGGVIFGWLVGRSDRACESDSLSVLVTRCCPVYAAWPARHWS